MKIIRASLIVLPFLLLNACDDEADQPGQRPMVVATTTMVADLARQIGGERVEVHGLMGPAVDPHSYVPRLSDTGLLERADLILYSGLHLEGRFQSTLEAMKKRGRAVVAVSSGVPDELLLAPQMQFEGAKDPHFWGDPALWIHAIEPVAAGLEAIDPSGAEEFRSRAAAYRAELEQLSAWARAQVESIPEERRVLATSHDAFFYFGSAYGFEVRGLQGVSTAAEAGVRDRTSLVEFLRERGVRTVFAETSVNSKGIAAVAAEAGAKVSSRELFSDALGMPGDTFEVDGRRYDRGTYIGMMVHNINTIATELR